MEYEGKLVGEHEEKGVDEYKGREVEYEGKPLSTQIKGLTSFEGGRRG